jgi:hypothetical protein
MMNFKQKKLLQVVDKPCNNNNIDNDNNNNRLSIIITNIALPSYIILKTAEVSFIHYLDK